MAAATAAGPREKITFEPNVPVYVVLDGPGQPQASSNGTPEFRYILEGRKIMWVAEDVHDAITSQGNTRGSEYCITKTKRGKAAATWTIEKIEEEPPAARELSRESTPFDDAPPPRPTRQLPPQQAREPRPTAVPQRNLPDAQADAEPTTMYAALCAAIRVTKAAEEYSQQIGRAVAFTTPDIRAIAASMYIHATGGR